MKAKVGKASLGAGYVKPRASGTCPKGSRHMKGRKGCWSVPKR